MLEYVCIKYYMAQLIKKLKNIFKKLKWFKIFMKSVYSIY
jgi:hypothetical protein